MITGAAASTVYHNLKLRHPTLDTPLIDYDLAVLFQPMLMLGISIGVVFNVLFPDWMVTVLLIILFLVTSLKAFKKGTDSWMKETLMKVSSICPTDFCFLERAKYLESNSVSEEDEYMPIPSGPDNPAQTEARPIAEKEFSIRENVCWKNLGLLLFVWIAFLVLQIAKNHTRTCSEWYWVVNLLQIPVAVGVSSYEAVSLYKGRRAIASKREVTVWKIHQLVLYCLLGIVAGIVGGLLGLGGGFILGPLFLELEIPPQVSSATATFAMTFSASMSVVEYYLLNRFPVPDAIYYIAVAAVGAYIGQHVMGKIILALGRASIIIFILSFTIFTSAVSLDRDGKRRQNSSTEQREGEEKLAPDRDGKRRQNTSQRANTSGGGGSLSRAGEIRRQRHLSVARRRNRAVEGSGCFAELAGGECRAEP
ncbi:hypothetical protein KSP40_PGU008511 [Platanthera guangdongensis]|uniref:Sulfite exporter TauE/SafE family protein n=1 Tax=Platanthera guangdongensis TaxID=2320717 RepID=A0ABR2M2T3_9ASPA